MSTSPAISHEDRRELHESSTVGDIMYPGIVSCSWAASAPEIARIMASCRIHCVAVMGLLPSDRQDPVIWGIVSDLDLLEAATNPEEPTTAAALAHQPGAHDPAG